MKSALWSVIRPHIPARAELTPTNALTLSDEMRYEQLLAENLTLTNKQTENLIIKESIFINVDFNSSTLKGLDLTDCRFINCNLANANLHGSNMQRVEFINCRFTGTQLSENYWRNITLQGCKGDYITLRFSDVKDAYIKECNLFESEWINSSLYRIKFEECDLTRSNMSQAKFSNTDIRGCQIEALSVSIHKLRGLIIDRLQCDHFARQLGLDIR